MGGHVRAESQLGVGTSFIINLKTKCKVIKQDGMAENNGNRPSEFIKSAVKGDQLVL